MTKLQINLPDELKAQLEARASEGGFGTVEQFAEAVLRASAEAGMSDADLEAMIARRADDPRPGIEFTPAFAADFREQVCRRRESRGAQP